MKDRLRVLCLVSEEMNTYQYLKKQLVSPRLFPQYGKIDVLRVTFLQRS